MKNIPLPSRIEFKNSDEDNRSILTVEPCFPGYGITIGNALRRVLLSSLPGAAITSFKIKGVQHEFSAVPDIKEDVVEIMLNLKKLRFKVFTDEPAKLYLKVKGEKIVTAKDIQSNSEVEIISSDLPIATLTSPKAELEMEMTVKRGRGYEPTEERTREEREKLEVGEITIDAIFTPIVDVGFEIEKVRVGQITNYERLILDIETDGTITPEQALGGAIEILLDCFNLLIGFGAKMPEISTEEKEEAEEMVEKKEESKEEIKEKEEEKTEEKPKKKRGRPKKE